jgi:hypothetical protein
MEGVHVYCNASHRAVLEIKYECQHSFFKEGLGSKHDRDEKAGHP